MASLDPGTDPTYCDGLSTQRCARCQVEVSTSAIVQVPGVGQICEHCDDEMRTDQESGTEVDL